MKNIAKFVLTIISMFALLFAIAKGERILIEKMGMLDGFYNFFG